jgi:gas vesicle protein
MKSESSKMLLGLGIGTVIGMAVGYLLNGNCRHQLEHKMCEMGHDIKEGAKEVFSEMKAKAQQTETK